MTTEPSEPGTVHRLATNAASRLAAGSLTGLVVGTAAAFMAPWQLAVLAGWDTAAATFLALVWRTVWHLDGDQTRDLAEKEDPNRFTTDVLLLITSVISLLGVGFMLVRASKAKGAEQAGAAAFAIVSVVLSWAVVQTVFTLRYARLHFQTPTPGVNFNEDDPPVYRDFAYLAFTVGMTYQVSDTDLQTKLVRSTALRHALLSYAFGTVIIAVTINAVAGFLH